MVYLKRGNGPVRVPTGTGVIATLCRSLGRVALASGDLAADFVETV